MSDAAPFDDLPSWLLTRAAARSHRILHRRLGEAGFTGYEYRVLSVLAAGGRQSQADVGRGAFLDRRDVTHTVRRLEDRGLIERRVDPTNRRVVLVEMTAQGKQQWKRLTPIMRAIQSELLAPLSPREVSTLTPLLARLGDEPTATNLAREDPARGGPAV